MVVGECLFGEKMKRIFWEVKFLKCYINYLIRVMVVIILDKLGFEVRYIMVVSGYRNEFSIWSYSRIDILIKRKMLEILMIECEVRGEEVVINLY